MKPAAAEFRWSPSNLKKTLDVPGKKYIFNYTLAVNIFIIRGASL